ncbi:MAG: coproporphyrinogen III oxidase family protein [Candidatus Portnoybacteria bacterium]|nr:coproporphyrinogen III oxidase family protein [Candidatus Portnoybacteria bacterium]
MLDFSNNIYEKIYSLAVKTNMVASCREYPSLAWNRQKIQFGTVRKGLQKDFSTPGFPCGLYVHFPFCKSRCTFCKYYSELSSNQNIFNDYLNALEQELKFYQVNFLPVILDNIFLGGGTPTLLNAEQIRRYLSIIYQFFRIDKKTQITIEGTPETTKLDTFKAWKDMGVNRVSLGVQSFNDQVLKAIGRTNNVKDIFKAFEIIRKTGIKFTGIDLIWGLPNENKKTYQKTVKDTLRLAPDYIECYLLTPGGRVKIEPYRPTDISLDEAIQLFKEGFLNNGYRLDFSGNFLSFVKKGVKRLEAVNRNTEGFYGYRSSCLGIGAGSSSLFPRLRYNIISRVENYIEDLLKNKRPPVYHGFSIGKGDYKRQYIMTQFGLRRTLYKNKYQRLFRAKIEDDFPRELALSKKNGILKETKNKLIWHFDEHQIGHRDYFWYALRYWYQPSYIRELVKNHNL